jgi:hypothetical protein
MRTLIVFAFLISVGTSVCANSNVPNSADLSNLSAAKRLEILKQIEDAQKPSDTRAPVDPKKVAEWLGVAEQVAGMVPILARNTAMGAQEVLDSTPGRILLTILLIKMFWGKLMGILFLTVGLAVWWHMFKKTFLIKEITYQPHPNKYLHDCLGLRQKTVVRNNVLDTWKKTADEPIFWAFIIAGLLNVIFGLVGITS